MLRHVNKEELFSMTTKQRVELFESLLRSTNRDGMEQVISALRDTDFYSAPASTRFHSNSVGGLLIHSLFVYATSVELYESLAKISPDIVRDITEENIVVASLLHDVCKINTYVKEVKWSKDASGGWISTDAYSYNDVFPFGHGDKSVLYLNMWGLKMTPQEMLAIRWHMGFWGALDKQSECVFRDALNNYPLVSIISNADTLSALVLEK